MAQPPHSNLPTVYPSVAPPGRAVLLSSYLLMAAALLLVIVVVIFNLIARIVAKAFTTDVSKLSCCA